LTSGAGSSCDGDRNAASASSPTKRTRSASNEGESRRVTRSSGRARSVSVQNVICPRDDRTSVVSRPRTHTLAQSSVADGLQAGVALRPEVTCVLHDQSHRMLSPLHRSPDRRHAQQMVVRTAGRGGGTASASPGGRHAVSPISSNCSRSSPNESITRSARRS